MIVSLELQSDPCDVVVDVKLLDDGAVLVDVLDLRGDTDIGPVVTWAGKCTTRELAPPPQGWRLRTA